MTDEMTLLTAADVHYKTFTATKFREGYDQDEVDQFLDQVVFTIQSLEERLTGEGASAPAAPAAPVAPATAAPEVDTTAYTDQIAHLTSELEAAREHITALEAERARLNEQVEASAGVVSQLQSERDGLSEELQAAREAQQSAPRGSGPEEASSMLAIAQRVHDEYVRDGEAEGNRIVTEARAKGEQIVREANEERTRVLDRLADERETLEQKVDDLKQFERDYRAQLRSHLESLIANVDDGEGVN